MTANTTVAGIDLPLCLSWDLVASLKATARDIIDKAAQQCVGMFISGSIYGLEICLLHTPRHGVHEVAARFRGLVDHGTE